MSHFLSDPITKKDSTQYITPAGLVIGKVGMQGWRDTMEDVDLIQIPFDLRTPETVGVGVFDGHGGSTISTAAAKRIVGQITSTSDFQKDPMSAQSLAAALCKGFIETDESLKRHPDFATTSDEVGSTGLLALITPTHVICSNIGDSRGILSNTNKQHVIVLSEDHKPDDEFEKQRILEAGGTVFRGRVCGGVAVSRSFGDFWFKRNAALKPHKQLVTAEPVVKIYTRDAADEFMILCCDGVYDVMSNDQVRTFIRSKLKSGMKYPKEIVELLVDECLRRGSRDNMTAVLVLFPAGLTLGNNRK